MLFAFIYLFIDMQSLTLIFSSSFKCSCKVHLWAYFQASIIQVLECRDAGEGEEKGSFLQPEMKGFVCAIQCWECSFPRLASEGCHFCSSFKPLLWMGESLMTAIPGKPWEAKQEGKIHPIP